MKIPSYSPGLFVNREEAVNLVVEKVRRIWRGEPERKRVVVFWGYRGAGKTWLLRHLAETILPGTPNVCAAYINLQDFQAKPVEDAVLEIVGKTLEALQRSLGQTPNVPFLWKPARLPLDEARRYLCEVADRALGTHVLVLLVDFVYEAAPDLLELLEKHVLGPLVVKPRVVMAMAGRGQANPWKTPQVRILVEEHELKPFGDPEHTREQLGKQRPGVASHADDIHKATLGYPLANVVIPYPLEKATPAEMRAMIDLLLEPIRRPDGGWPLEREHLQALCVLRNFDEERIPVLLDAYQYKRVISNIAAYHAAGGGPGGWTLARANEILRGLIHTKLVRWNPDTASWWIVDQAIRHLLEEYLRVVEPERWRCCHQTAINLYTDWQTRYPEEADRWREEVKYHEGRLGNKA